MSSVVACLVDLPNPTTGHKGEGWWAAWCRDCGEWVTKFDHSADEGLAHSIDHECVAPCLHSRMTPGCSACKRRYSRSRIR